MKSSLLTPALGHSPPLYGQSQVVVTLGSRKEGQRAEVWGKGFFINQVMHSKQSFPLTFYWWTLGT